MQTAPAKSQHMEEVTALAHRLVEIVSEQQTHQVGLDALISAYVSVAVCHPCCAQKAADLARRAADVIESSAAPVGTQHIH
ncbi:MAG: hypothetical protein KJZ76_16815 [Burkholderiaceae bacterium]|nr:hypothetical protein [Burkholderiaceae bacterium]